MSDSNTNQCVQRVESVGDYISRQMVIDALSTPHGILYPIRTVEELPSAQPDQRWISSGKRPPEEGSYLVWMPFAPPKHRMAVAEYCGEYWNIKTPISAWMPLPEPYKGGETE